MNYNNILNLLRLSLSGKATEECISSHQDLFSSVDWQELYGFLSGHTIAPLVSDLIKFIPEECDVKTVWQQSTFVNLCYYFRLVDQQKQILDAFQNNQIPVAVLKGTSAAKYYPKPELRSMGDIDLLVKPEDYERAVNCLIYIGCTEVTSQSEMEKGRHRNFSHKGALIELHHFFSLCSDKEKASALDDTLVSAISSDVTVLPDEENGLVFLSHIRQHLENGLGLRQIIDWMMFAKSCLDDEMWFSSFQKKVNLIGLEKLAITVTKMCQKYLGLTTENITWCESADEDVCNQLMQYVMDCGNFGRSRGMLQSTSVEKLPSLSHPVKLFKYIQAHGEHNWKALKKHPWLKPVAWIYQSCRYIKLAVHNKVGAKKLKGIYDEGEKRNKMFAELGIKL